MRKFSTIKTANSDLAPTNSRQGKVYLVGAGPGAADLLTIKALKVIESCDVILYDNLVSEEIRKLIPSKTQKIFVGKKKNLHSVAQQNLNQVLVDYAKKGMNVCRLKGGDPFVFGRGSEEMLTLKQNNIEAEVVPGITAASGCTSYAGIPLTHRGISQGCTFLTGHTEKEPNFDWQSIARLEHTLVFYMGLSKLAFISQKLIEHGIKNSTPVALIESGSTQHQKVVSTKLKNLLPDTKELVHVQTQLKSPCLIVIGKTVQLREQLKWFEKDLPEINQQYQEAIAYARQEKISA